MSVSAAASAIANYHEITDALGRMDGLRQELEAAVTGELSPLEIAARNLEKADKAYEEDPSHENFSKLQVAQNAFEIAYKGASPADKEKIMESVMGGGSGFTLAGPRAAFERGVADAQTGSDKTRDL